MVLQFKTKSTRCTSCQSPVLAGSQRPRATDEELTNKDNVSLMRIKRVSGEKGALLRDFRYTLALKTSGDGRKVILAGLRV